MENHISQIELINQYIDKQLSETESLNFENQLESNPEFITLYQEQLIFIEGLKRTQLKLEIASAKRSYIKRKWLKIIGLVIVVLGLFFLCYSLFFNQLNNENQLESFQNEKRIGTETSVILTDSSKHKFVVIRKTEKTIFNDVLTRQFGSHIYTDTVLSENLGSFTKTEFDIKFPKLTTLKPVNDTLIIKETVVRQKAVSEVKLAKVQQENVVSIKEDVEVLKTSKNTRKSFVSFYNSVKKTPQIIEINTEKETIITCKEGTVLSIPAKCFVDAKTGKLARGIVALQVTEYYKLSDMLLANLTTKSDDKQLETGGMLYVKAFKDNSQLQLKSGSLIEYKFPANNKKRGMQLFLGEKTNAGVNWNLENKPNTTTTVLTSEEVVFLEEVEDVEVPIDVVEVVPTFPGCENSTNTEKIKCFKEALSNLVSKNFDIGLAEELNLSGKHKIRTYFKIDKNGDVIDIQASAANTALANEAIRVLKLIPKLKPGTQRGKPVIVPYGLPIQFTVDGSTKNNPSLITVKDKTSFERKFEERIKSRDSTTTGLVGTVTSSDVSRYAFYGSKLGWINCDRFIGSSKNAIKFKLKIKNANGANVKMVFKSLNSILPSKNVNDSYDFGTVTANEAVVLVAIKKVDDRLYLGLKEAKVEAISELDVDFKEVSLDQLKTELRKLNKDFN
ncbi:energy transducer TonB [Olleya namhaensis]|uniref:energy transducer TonB n=1 Tax=Olleya namhaensis TaxID=1144750 RepID=UPI002492D4AB|nr:energy transducer TonB [Olleya namhaensis]